MSRSYETTCGAAGLYKGVGGSYIVKSNRESGEGRYDILIESPDYTKAVLLELKAVGKKTELEQGCQAALRQIEDRGYAKELLSDGYDEVVCYGVAFWRKLCRVRQSQP